jgi:predicted nucleic acid-binding protein
MTGSVLDLRSDDTEAILHGLERLGNAMVAPLRDGEQPARLAAVIARSGLNPWDAHVAAVADAAICPILTLDAGKCRQHSGDLDEPHPDPCYPPPGPDPPPECASEIR